MADVVVVTRRVLVALDGSHHSYEAFNWYMKHVHTANDYVIVAFCPDLTGGMFAAEMMTSPSAIGNALKTAQEGANDQKNTLEEKLAHSGAKGCVVMLAGNNPGHSIVKEAEKEQVSLIVVGSRGHGVIRRTVMGSVSGYVVHHAHVPVLVCKHPKDHHGHHGDDKISVL